LISLREFGACVELSITGIRRTNDIYIYGGRERKKENEGLTSVNPTWSRIYWFVREKILSPLSLYARAGHQTHSIHFSPTLSLLILFFFRRLLNLFYFSVISVICVGGNKFVFFSISLTIAKWFTKAADIVSMDDRIGSDEQLLNTGSIN